jgi:hypothetical protein
MTSIPLFSVCLDPLVASPMEFGLVLSVFLLKGPTASTLTLLRNYNDLVCSLFRIYLFIIHFLWIFFS